MQKMQNAWSGLMPCGASGWRMSRLRGALAAVLELTCVVSLLIGLGFPDCLRGATRSQKQRVIPNWALFEQALVSTLEYTNPVQQVSLTAVFTSPEGRRRTVNGFWDGGRVWRVRFCPDVPGQWTYTTFCSDPKNAGLDGQTGHFLCTAPIGDNAFRQHGPVRVARDHTHFEHADGTPFFWLADTAGPGAALSGTRDWQRYASVRGSQLFNVVLWDAGAGEDFEHESALTGFAERIVINPKFFQHLDEKLDALSREGILSAILPLQSPRDSSGKELPDDQAALLLSYMQARWGEQSVAWVIHAGDQATDKQFARVSKVCSAVFTNQVHAPVVLYVGQAANMADRFVDQKWADAFGVEAASRPSGGPGEDASLNAARPIVLFAPCENGLNGSSNERFKPDDVRHAVYQGLLQRPPAGVTYAAWGVTGWDTSVDPKASAGLGAGMPLWERALFMPGAKQMRSLANLMNSIEFWRLRPRPDAIPNQPSEPVHAVAACTPAKDLTVVYLPQSSPVDVSLQAMPPSPIISWVEPRQGSLRSAVAVMSGSSCEFPPPGKGDWVLLIKSSK